MGLLEEPETLVAPIAGGEPLSGGGGRRDLDFIQHVAAMMEWRPQRHPSMRRTVTKIPEITPALAASRVGTSSFQTDGAKSMCGPDRTPVARSVTFVGGVLVAGLDDGRICCLEGREPRQWDGHEGPVADVLPFADGRLFTRGLDGRLCLWELDGTLVHEWRRLARVDASAVAGDRLAVATGDLVRFFPGKERRVSAKVWSLAASPREGEWFAGLSDGSVAWITDDGVRRIDPARAHRRTPVYAVAVSPDRRWLAAGDGACLIQVWSLEPTPRVEKVLRDSFYVTALSFDPSSRYLAAGDESCHVSVRQVPNFQTIVRSQHHVECWVGRAAWSPSGDRLAFACRGSAWSLKAGHLWLQAERMMGRFPNIEWRGERRELEVWTLAGIAL